MSCERDTLDQSISFTKGHNDAWEGKPPTLPCSCLSCPINSRYKEGHRAGTTARYYYDKGYQAGKEDK
jgi:hypothetical protein